MQLALVIYLCTVTAKTLDRMVLYEWSLVTVTYWRCEELGYHISAT